MEGRSGSDVNLRVKQSETSGATCDTAKVRGHSYGGVAVCCLTLGNPHRTLGFVQRLEGSGPIRLEV